MSREHDPSALTEDFEPNEAGLIEGVQKLLSLRGAPGTPVPAMREQCLPLSLPEKGVGAGAALALLSEAALGGVTRLDHPGFLAHMDPPTPWMTWVAAMWAASTNQNLLHPDTAPMARDIENQVVSWLAPFFGMDGGHVVPGSTVANLTALWAARDVARIDRVVTSAASHLSIRKAAGLLGLGYEEIPVDDQQRLDVSRLGDLSGAALVLTAGTVATGAVDPLGRRWGASWVHVDAAWAGPLLLSPAHAGILGGIETADSVGVSAHKWLYQPKESALVFFHDSERAHDALTFGGGYLKAPNVGLLGSHGFAALPLAVSLMAWGRVGVAELLDAGMAAADSLARLVDAHGELRLWRPPVTGVVNWKPSAADVDPRCVQQRLATSWVSTAVIADQVWWRSVAANPRVDPQHVFDEVVAAIREC